VSGVSVGALNSAIIAMHPPGNERAALAELIDFYKNIKVSDLWKFWGGILFKPFFKNSFLDMTLFHSTV
jgi:hypothetical protein